MQTPFWFISGASGFARRLEVAADGVANGTQFFCGQIPISTRLQHAQFQRADAGSPQAGNFQPQRFAHPANLAVSALLNGHQQYDTVWFFGFHNDVCRQGHFAVQFHAAGKGNQLFFGNIRPNGNPIGLGNMAARVHDVVGKFAVIRQQQESFGVLVQSADGVNPFFHAVQQVHDTAAVEFIGSGGDIASGLVQHEITLDFFARDANGFSVDGNEVGTGCLVAEATDVRSASDAPAAIKASALRREQ